MPTPFNQWSASCSTSLPKWGGDHLYTVILETQAAQRVGKALLEDTMQRPNFGTIDGHDAAQSVWDEFKRRGFIVSLETR